MKYRVLVTTKVRMWSSVEVEAESPEEAKEKALAAEQSWEFEDWQDHEAPFIEEDADVAVMA